jgi:hypothetical protein
MKITNNEQGDGVDHQDGNDLHESSAGYCMICLLFFDSYTSAEVPTIDDAFSSGGWRPTQP